MPKGKGTYGSKVGRPVKMKKPKKKKQMNTYIHHGGGSSEINISAVD